MDAYLIDPNATQAALTAGYSKKTAAVIGVENLHKPKIQALLAADRAKRSERTQIDADYVLTELAKLAGSNLLDYLDIDVDGKVKVNLAKITRDQGSCLSGVEIKQGPYGTEVKFKLIDRLRALEAAGKHVDINAFGKPEDDRRDVEIHVVTHIPGAPGSAREKQDKPA